MAGRTNSLSHHTGDFLLDIVGICLTVSALKAGNYAFKGVVHMRDTAGLAGVCVFELALPGSVQQIVFELNWQIPICNGQIRIVILRQLIEHLPVEAHSVHRREHLSHSAFKYALVRIGYDILVIYFESKAEASACLAGSIRCIEREHPGFHLLNTHSVFRTSQQRAKSLLVFPGCTVIVLLPKEYVCNALAFHDCKLNRFSDTAAILSSEHNSVDDYIDRMLDVLVELELLLLVQPPHLAVQPDPDVPVSLDTRDYVLVLALATLDDRCKNSHARALFMRHDMIHNRIDRLAGYHSAAYRTVGNTYSGVQQSQIVIDLRDRSYSRSGILVGSLLVNRDGRR